MNLPSPDASMGINPEKNSSQEYQERARNLFIREDELASILRQDYDLRSSEITSGLGFRDKSKTPDNYQIFAQLPTASCMFREYPARDYMSPEIDFNKLYGVDTRYVLRVEPKQPVIPDRKPRWADRFRKKQNLRSFTDYYVDNDGHTAKVIVTENSNPKKAANLKRVPIEDTDFDQMENALSALSSVLKSQ